MWGTIFFKIVEFIFKLTSPLSLYYLILRNDDIRNDDVSDDISDDVRRSVEKVKEVWNLVSYLWSLISTIDQELWWKNPSHPLALRNPINTPITSHFQCNLEISFPSILRHNNKSRGILNLERSREVKIKRKVTL